MSWSDRIIIMGVGTTPEREREIEEGYSAENRREAGLVTGLLP
jgi:hypothetical protein